MKLFDSIKKQKLPFESVRANEVRIYVCGPTVYDDAHLGHARSSIAFDLWRRLFMFLGYKVIFAKNFTDIDDKIIKKSLQSSRPIDDITAQYIESYLRDMQALSVLRPDLEPKATENLPQMCEMIQALLHKGYAYVGENNDIYLQITKDSKYGSLSHRAQDSHAQSRIENAHDKLESSDFALWKGYKGEGDLGYESALGKGRPGWHIECSAMIESHLAYENEPYAIDIHAGGADLLFPHHENEASQTRCATGREIAKYWLHNGFVNINGEKMSKSLGNSFFVKDALKAYDGEILRNYLLGVHYRLGLNFNEEDLLQSKKRLDKLYRLKKRLGDIDSKLSDSMREAVDTLRAFARGESYEQNRGDNYGKNYKERVESSALARAFETLKSSAQEAFLSPLIEALSDDYNISKALSIIEDMLSHANEGLDKAPKDTAYKLTIYANLACVEWLLGLLSKEAARYFQLGVDEELRQVIESKLEKRAQAKAAKDYALADSLRDELKGLGIDIMDSAQGTLWEKI